MEQERISRNWGERLATIIQVVWGNPGGGLQTAGTIIYIYGRDPWPGSEAEVVVDRYRDLLFACGIDRGRLDRLVAQHVLNLLELAAFLPA